MRNRWSAGSGRLRVARGKTFRVHLPHSDDEQRANLSSSRYTGEVLECVVNHTTLRGRHGACCQ